MVQNMVGTHRAPQVWQRVINRHGHRFASSSKWSLHAVGKHSLHHLDKATQLCSVCRGQAPIGVCRS